MPFTTPATFMPRAFSRSSGVLGVQGVGKNSIDVGGLQNLAVTGNLKMRSGWRTRLRQSPT